MLTRTLVTRTRNTTSISRVKTLVIIRCRAYFHTINLSAEQCEYKLGGWPSVWVTGFSPIHISGLRSPKEK